MPSLTNVDSRQYGHRFTATGSMPQIHCHRFTATGTLPQIRCHRFTVTDSLPQVHCHRYCHRFTATGSLPQVLPQVRCHRFTATGTATGTLDSSILLLGVRHTRRGRYATITETLLYDKCCVRQTECGRAPFGQSTSVDLMVN